MDKPFNNWVVNLSEEYRRSQIKASIRVNSELIRFYFKLGKEINETSFKKQYGKSFFKTLSLELTKRIPNAKGFSPINLWYIESFYILYRKIFQQVAEKFKTQSEMSDYDSLVNHIFLIPWGHHMLIIDKCSNNINKAWFYVNKTIENNWSRSVLLNFISSGLYEREGRAITNFSTTLPKEEGDLAKQLIKDPYCFDFIEVRDDYNEKELKDALVNNIKDFLIELGKGFAYLGREYRLEVGDSTVSLDMLFYNTQIHAYVVVEVKITKFTSEFIGQLGTYVAIVDDVLRTNRDDKTIGILICKEKNDVLVKYSLSASSEPLGISSYDFNKLIPEKFKSSLPTIEEFEDELNRKE